MQLVALKVPGPTDDPGTPGAGDSRPWLVGVFGVRASVGYIYIYIYIVIGHRHRSRVRYDTNTRRQHTHGFNFDIMIRRSFRLLSSIYVRNTGMPGGGKQNTFDTIRHKIRYFDISKRSIRYPTLVGSAHTSTPPTPASN